MRQARELADNGWHGRRSEIQVSRGIVWYRRLTCTSSPQIANCYVITIGNNIQYARFLHNTDISTFLPKKDNVSYDEGEGRRPESEETQSSEPNPNTR